MRWLATKFPLGIASELPMDILIHPRKLDRSADPSYERLSEVYGRERTASPLSFPGPGGGPLPHFG